MKKLLLASLLLVAFLAGCTEAGKKVAAGNGLVIKSFAPDFGEVRSGESITLSAMVENVGEADATDIAVHVFGLNLGETATSEWRLLSGSNPQLLSILRKADPTLNLAGESYEFSWALRSPENLKVDNTYTADVRTYYKYKTSSTATLRFLTYNYLKSLPSDQFETVKKTSGVTQSLVSGAPVSVSMTVGARPLIVYTDGDSFSVQITLSNVGAGNTFKVDAPYPGYHVGATLASENLYYVDVNIVTDLGLDCSSVLGTAKSGRVMLTRGKSKTMFCAITIPSLTNIPNTRDYSVAVDLTYGYYMDSSTSIKVLKSEAITPTTDTTAPAAVSNLATSSPTSSSITLTWTATGDDGVQGKATRYDIRRSGSTITPSNFKDATPISGVSAPKISGSSETFTVTSLSASTTYFFATNVTDEVNNWSLSNVVSAATIAAAS